MRSTAVWLFPYPEYTHPLPAFLKQVIQGLNDSCQIGEKFSVIIEKTKERPQLLDILRLRVDTYSSAPWPKKMDGAGGAERCAPVPASVHT